MSKYKSKTQSEQSQQAVLYKDIVKALRKYLKKNGQVRLESETWKYSDYEFNAEFFSSSIFVYDHGEKKSGKKIVKEHAWEEDFFFVDLLFNKWSIEIKVDRQDFTRSEKKKVKKHFLLNEAFETNNKAGHFLPNYFYYCAPEGMISPDELEPYAGLMEINERGNISFKTPVVKIHDVVEDPADLFFLLARRFHKKVEGDEKKYIKLINEFNKCDQSNPEVLRKLILNYQSAKRFYIR